jgi:drug/metabolite transporter (DMT)-like permease
MSTASATDLTRAMALGLLGVVIFAFSIPMTRLAGGTAELPQLDPLFVAFGRAAVAGICSIFYLRAVGARRLASADFRPLLLTAAGVVLGWPIFLGLAVREVEAVHASVISGVLPLVTAMIAATVLRQRPSRGFWASATVGCALVVAYALLRSWQQTGAVHVVWADLLLLAAVISAAFGYVSGAQLSQRIPPAQVICWVVVLSLPLTVPVTVLTWPSQAIALSAWMGFAYVAIFSMWLGFFAWYRALALGGTVRVSQVQLLQPFLSLLFCVPVLGESLDALTVGFSLAIIATVAWSKRQAVN